jgi:hypothetical protein
MTIDFESMVKPPSDDDLSTISSLAKELVDLDGRIAKGEEYLRSLKEQRRKIAEDSLPEAVKAAGLREFTLTDGSAIEMDTMTFASISEANKLRALSWLRANGFGDIIKHVIKFELGRGEDEKAETIKRLAAEEHVEYDSKAGVHVQTLRKWARDYVAEHGTPDPESDVAKLFALHVKDIAKVIPPL